MWNTLVGQEILAPPGTSLFRQKLPFNPYLDLMNFPV